MGNPKDKDEEEYTYSDYKEQEKKETQKKKSIVKWVVAFLVELIVLVVLIASIIQLKVKHAWEKMDVKDLSNEDLMINVKSDGDMADYTNIVFFGLDARDDNLEGGSNSDTIMIASINNKTKNVKLVSIYRDTLLRIPIEGVNAKANSAYAYGGAVLGIQMLNQNLDMNIEDYVTVNWEALSRAIDILGGVTVDVDEEELKKMNEYITEQIAANGLMSNGIYETGEVTLNGVQATAYARVRSTDQGDITRTGRQREVLEAMIGKLKEADMDTINKLVDGVFPYIETSISQEDFADLAGSAKSYILESTVGFPFEYEYYEDEEKGSCLAAKNLHQNVVALHNYLFGTVAYEATDAMKENDAKLTKETGVGDNGPVIVHPEAVED